MKRSLRVIVPLVCLLLLPMAFLNAQDDKKWDVNAADGPTTPLSFDTDEGTWMNLDVSPDGRTIVFDLLGDVYTMPAAGGRATRIAGGATFDMQPRFSPDGKRIAFTSDRDGLWNIWTMDVDGKDAKQVSHEKQWWVNSPTWSPDGQYIFARRHFVAFRSLGSGEIWMFHASGANGPQYGDAERPPLRRQDAERDRQSAERAAEALVGTVTRP